MISVCCSFGTPSSPIVGGWRVQSVAWCMHATHRSPALHAYLCCSQVRIVKHACEIIHLLTDQNPIQVIVDAIINR
jgi:hypothetical protein